MDQMQPYNIIDRLVSMRRLAQVRSTKGKAMTDTLAIPAVPNMLRATVDLAPRIQSTVSAYWLQQGPTESAAIIGDADAGDYWHYRPDTWDEWPLSSVQNTRLFLRIWDDAQAENAWRELWDEAHAENALRSGDGPVEDDAADRVARALGANEAQLAKLRQLVQDRRDAQREAETLRAQLAQTRTELSVAQAEITDGGDERLIPFWERAAEQATNAGYCSEYDRMAEMLNGLPRERAYDVEVTFRIRGRLRVTARSDEDAESIVSDMRDAEVWREASVDPNYDIQEVEIGDVELSD